MATMRDRGSPKDAISTDSTHLTREEMQTVLYFCILRLTNASGVHFFKRLPVYLESLNVEQLQDVFDNKLKDRFNDSTRSSTKAWYENHLIRRKASFLEKPMIEIPVRGGYYQDTEYRLFSEYQRHRMELCVGTQPNTKEPPLTPTLPWFVANQTSQCAPLTLLVMAKLARVWKCIVDRTTIDNYAHLNPLAAILRGLCLKSFDTMESPELVQASAKMFCKWTRIIVSKNEQSTDFLNAADVFVTAFDNIPSFSWNSVDAIVCTQCGEIDQGKELPRCSNMVAVPHFPRLLVALGKRNVCRLGLSEKINLIFEPNGKSDKKCCGCFMQYQTIVVDRLPHYLVLGPDFGGTQDYQSPTPKGKAKPKASARYQQLDEIVEIEYRHMKDGVITQEYEVAGTLLHQIQPAHYVLLWRPGSDKNSTWLYYDCLKDKMQGKTLKEANKLVEDMKIELQVLRPRRCS